MLGGADLSRFTLRDWLDAGYAFLVRDADGTARQLFDALFAAEDADEMSAGFDALAAELNWRKEQADAAEAEAQRRARKAGSSPRPRPAKRVSQSELDAAAAEWGAPVG